MQRSLACLAFGLTALLPLANAGVLDDIRARGEVRLGYPALPGMQYHRSSAVFKNLPELARRVTELEKRLDESRGA